MKRNNLKNKIFLIILIPVIGFVLYGSFTIFNSYQNLESIENSKRFLSLLSNTEDVINEIQKERGLSAGFLVSKGKIYGKQLKYQREHTDKAIKKIKNFLKNFDYQNFNNDIQIHISKIPKTLSTIKYVRTQVDNLSINVNQEINEYTFVIKYLLNTNIFFTLINKDYNTASIIHHYNIISSIKEASGQERALLNKAFSSNKLNSYDYIKLSDLVSSENTELNQLIKLANNKKIKNKLIDIKNDKDIKQYRTIAFSKIKKIEILTNIQSLIGYGGLIHTFKNYLLRGDKIYIKKFLKLYKKFKQNIDEYKKLPYINKDEIKLLNDISNTFKQYKERLDIISKQTDYNVKKLDKVVKIDDKPALEAIKTLKDNLIGIDSKKWFQVSTKRINDLYQVSKIYNEEFNKKVDDYIFKKVVVLSTVIISLIIIILSTGYLSLKLTNNLLSSLKNFENGLNQFFKYLNKETKEVHNIKITDDEIGNMSKTINENIRKIKKGFDTDREMIDELIKCVNTVEKGILDTQISINPNQEDLKKVKEMFNLMMKNLETKIGKNINNILYILDNFSKYNYTKKINNPYGKIEKSLNDLGSLIDKMLKENLHTSELLKSKSSILFSTVHTLEDNTNKQKNLVSTSSKQLETITEHINMQVNKSSKMAEYSKKVNQSVDTGTNLADKTSNAMETMDHMVDKITKSIEIIEQIVVQTNILSLNASVEAVSAGDAGKGFSVVAQEVRNLAGKSSNASKEIQHIVNEAKIKAKEGKVIVQDMIEGYEELKSNIAKTIELIKSSINISHQQENNINQIQSLISQLDTQANKTTNIVAQTKNIAKDTSIMAKQIVESNVLEKELV